MKSKKAISILMIICLVSLTTISCKQKKDDNTDNSVNSDVGEIEKEEEVAMYKDIEEIEKLVNTVIEEGKFYSGIAITVANKDNLLYEYYAGTSIVSETEQSVNYDRDKIFNIGSVTKPITASLIMKLQEEGSLNINDKVQKYLPLYKYDDVTILNLMTHTAGYDVTKVGIGWPLNKMGYSAFLKAIYALPKASEVDKASAYFTNGYTLLLEIIEKQSKMSIEEYATKVLFEPLNMNFTHYDIEKADDANFILPYTTNYSSGKQTFDTYLRFAPPTGDSSLLSNAYDMIKFGRVILNDGMYRDKEIFKKETVEKMLTEITDGKFDLTPVFMANTKKPSRGFFSSSNTTSVVGHPGFSGGAIWIDKEKNLTAVIITNSTKMGTEWMQLGNNNMKKISDAIANYNWE